MKKLALLSIATLLIFSLIFPSGIIAGRRFSVKSDSQSNSIATNLGLFGSYTGDIAVDPTSNYIYIAAWYTPNGFFRSSNDGQTWVGMTGNVDYGSGQDVEVNPSNGHVFILLQDLLKSTNHGRTVSEIKNANGSSILFHSNKLFVGTGSGQVKVSTNEGASFSTATLDTSYSIRSLAGYGDTIYALGYNYNDGSNKVFKSTNAGSSWSELSKPVTLTDSLDKIGVNPANGSVFLIPISYGTQTYRSINGGTDWTLLNGAPVTGNISFDSTGRVYIGWNYSIDNGDNWTAFGRGGNYNHHIVVDPSNNNTLYDTSSPGFWKSTDQGATWTSSVDGIIGVVVTSVSQANNKNIVWTATQNGYAKCTNFNSTSPDWSYPVRPNNNFISGGQDSIWVHPSEPNIVLAGCSGALWRTADSGTSWTQMDMTIGSGAPLPSEIVSDSNANNIYVAVAKNVGSGQTAGFIKSADEGATWSSMSFPTDSAQSVAVAKDGDIYVGAGSGAREETTKGIYKYSSGAWSRLSAPNANFPSIVADPENANTIYAVAKSGTSAGFYKTTNGGKTWTRITSGLSGLQEFTTLTIQKSTTPNSLYLGAVLSKDQRGAIYKSSDGGTSWGVFYKGLKSESFRALLFDGLVAGNERGLYNVKSKAKLVLSSNKKTGLMKVSLRDATTFKKRKKVGKKKKIVNTYKQLRNRIVTIYKLTKKRVKVKKRWRTKKVWKKVKNVKIGKAGYTWFRVRAAKGTILQARWKPVKRSDKAEYAAAKSGNSQKGGRGS
ncbi:MAG: hypothetical protein C4562_04635 [Actinobacteria bacterium]|nr:MAG: hypothetical protein C4562_04635 [Actinomycetota bacterium]